MSKVSVVIDGVSRDATLIWDSVVKRLVSNGAGNYSASFNSGTGKHKYVIRVFGAPDDRWAATIETPSAKNSHQGLMNQYGRDSTGSVQIKV